MNKRANYNTSVMQNRHSEIEKRSQIRNISEIHVAYPPIRISGFQGFHTIVKVSVRPDGDFR